MRVSGMVSGAARVDKVKSSPATHLDEGAAKRLPPALAGEGWGGEADAPLAPRARSL
jgi:hypothetical protein